MRKKKTKPRLQPRAFASPISISVTPRDKQRLLAWMREQNITQRSVAFRKLLELVGA